MKYQCMKCKNLFEEFIIQQEDPESKFDPIANVITVKAKATVSCPFCIGDKND